ncbi:unnamed protein product [Ectocarpus sp. 8 AP-2014]
MSSTMRSPEITRSPARVAGAGAGGRNLQSIGRQRSLVEDHPDNERIPARTVCAAFSLLVLGLVSSKEACRSCKIPHPPFADGLSKLDYSNTKRMIEPKNASSESSRGDGSSAASFDTATTVFDAE